MLKVGKVGTKSGARYLSQHYIPGSAMSTLAGSILKDPEKFDLTELAKLNIGPWIEENIDRVNILIHGTWELRLLSLLEAFLQCRLNPRYEGFKSQKYDGSDE